jgi:hypothetical protein
MIFRNRILTRVGAAAVGLLAAGALAAPVYAAGTETDLALTVVGTKLAANAEFKVAFAKITNNGENTPTKVSISADLSGLDLNKIVVEPAVDECVGSESTRTITCTLPEEQIPGPGQTADVPILLVKGEGAGGPYTGPVKFTIESPDDTTPNNNSKTVDVTISGQSGADLTVLAEDVREEIDLAKSTTEPFFTGEAIHPGDTAALLGFVVNQGDMTAKGVKVTATLPKQVTYAEEEEGCVYSADNRTVTCLYAQISLIPAEKDNDPDDDMSGFAVFWFPVKVAEGVTAPVALKGGTFAAAALGQVEYEEQASTLNTKAAPKLPANVKLLDASDFTDVDPSDNVDGFSVIVAGEGGAGGGEGEGPGLPVTGVQAGLIGGLGAGVVALGGALVLFARRRRVVLVTPGDEKPTA